MSVLAAPAGPAAQAGAPPSLRLEIGVVRAFGLADIGGAGLVAGWSTPEAAHNWNDGAEAVLDLATRRPDFPCTLVVEGTALLGGKLRFQDLTVFAGGLRLGFWRLRPDGPAGGGSHVLEVPIPPSAWRSHGDDTGEIRLHFHLPGSTRLSELEPDGDDRELGFCFRTLALFPASHG